MQGPGLGQAGIERGGGKHVCEYSTLQAYLIIICESSISWVNRQNLCFGWKPKKNHSDNIFFSFVYAKAISNKNIEINLVHINTTCIITMIIDHKLIPI